MERDLGQGRTLHGEYALAVEPISFDVLQLNLMYGKLGQKHWTFHSGMRTNNRGQSQNQDALSYIACIKQTVVVCSAALLIVNDNKFTL